MTDPKNILVRMPNWVGDLVMATPILTDLRHAYPDASITAMCRCGLEGLLEHDQDINEVFCVSKPSGWLPRDENRDVMGKIRSGHYDLGVLLTNSFGTSWQFWRGGVKRRIGFRNEGRSFLLTDRVSFPKAKERQHLVRTYKKLLTPLGIEPSTTLPRIHLLQEELDQAQELLARQGVPSGCKLVGVNPGAAYGSAKCWLPDRFREVTKRLVTDESVYVLFFGDRSQVPLVKEICQGFPDRVINLAGATTLRELVCLISLCDAVLTNDSGPMHIAAAVGTPLLALFGSTNEVKTGPCGPGKKSVIHKHVECSPCYLRQCPIDFRCMKQISSEEVYDSLVRLAHG